MSHPCCILVASWMHPGFFLVVSWSHLGCIQASQSCPCCVPVTSQSYCSTKGKEILRPSFIMHSWSRFSLVASLLHPGCISDASRLLPTRVLVAYRMHPGVQIMSQSCPGHVRSQSYPCHILVMSRSRPCSVLPSPCWVPVTSPAHPHRIPGGCSSNSSVPVPSLSHPML